MKNPNRTAAIRRAEANGDETDTIVIYNSKSGSTLQYAKWISTALRCDIMPYTRRRLGLCTYYNNVIFGGWIRNGEITRLNMLKQNFGNFNLDTKNVIIFGVGIAEPTARYIERLQAFNWQYAGEETAGTEDFFYLPGRFDNRRGAQGRLALMGAANSILRGMPQEEVDIFIDRIEGGYNGMDPKYIEPIIDRVHASQGLLK